MSMINGSRIEVYMSFFRRKMFQSKRKFCDSIKRAQIFKTIGMEKMSKKRITMFYNSSRFVALYHLSLGSVTRLKPFKHSTSSYSFLQWHLTEQSAYTSGLDLLWTDYKCLN